MNSVATSHPAIRADLSDDQSRRLYAYVAAIVLRDRQAGRIGITHCDLASRRYLERFDTIFADLVSVPYAQSRNSAFRIALAGL